ncbi:MAG: glutaredoxin domain-containing protein [SAR202 cluster bacterium]|nr:glutaredoxin domain-containing protein [SAR202 cluster bacterium]MDP7104996.1 glutaredoxin domain-containing protein [SAR202 cluster bacterium]
MYGARWCPDCKRAKQFLGEQRVTFRWVDINEDEAGRDYVREINDGKQIIPTIVFEDGSLLVEPPNAELAAKLNINPKAERSFYNLTVIGGGPAGLTSAIYAAREGIDTLIIERSGVGGQVGVTERIDNYPGFPDGIAGGQLADQMRAHAERFGVKILPRSIGHERAGYGRLQARHNRDRRRVLLRRGDHRDGKPVSQA